ncbi:hypothetical protein SARC_09238 [Sphaeroforma arctica JP610]|uniref:BHLH domain-containing protein n=1 Tax=Sphaeroforma arctica JP610 TaxID=667725 RepID=A0A0L0FNE5_9EUKA|nr:hypothetical protein SARC_09238 [Sphaeroforma arctica JP610]KNC78325.1 hypothetical protein SARC_09238 [Sphaeroforma arctica JP610]|eukprot:XP_014152227.1 hypothetical protein SARC_09238 [Sphaeroforma arctica JP610]
MGSSPVPAVTSHAANIQNGDTNTNASVIGIPNHTNNTVMDAQTSVGGVAIATADSAAKVSGQMPAAAQSVPGYHTTSTSQVQISTQQAVQGQGQVPGNIQVANTNTYTQETTPGQHTAFAQVSSATTSAAKIASHQSPTLSATEPTPSTEPGAKGVEVSSALQQGQTQTRGTVNSTLSTQLPMHTTLQMQAQAHMTTYQSQQPQQTTHTPPQTYTQPQPQQQQPQSSIPSQPVQQNQATTQGQVQTHSYTQQQQQGPPPQAQGIQPVQSQNAIYTYQGKQARVSPLAPPQTFAQPQANTYTQAQPTAYTPTQPQAYTQQPMNTYVQPQAKSSTPTMQAQSHMQPQTHVQTQTQAFTPTSTSTQANVSPQVQAQGLVKTGGGPVPASHTNVTSNMSVKGSANTAGNTGVTSNRPSNASSTSMPAQSPYMHTNMGTSSPTPTTNTNQGNASPIPNTTGAYAYTTAPTLNAPGAGPNATTTYKPTPGSNAGSPTVGATSRMSASTASGASPGTVTCMGTVLMKGVSPMSGAATQANASVNGTNGTAPFPMATSPAPASTMTGGVGRASGSGGVPPLYAASNTFTQTAGGNANTTANTTNTNTYTQKNTTYAPSNTYAQATTPAGAPAGTLTYAQNTVQAKTVPNSGQTGATLGARVKDEPMAKPLSAQELAAQSLASAGYGTSTLNTNTGAGVGTNQRSTASPGPQNTTMSTTYTTGATTASSSAYGSIPPVTAAPTHPTQAYTYTTTSTSTVPGTSTSANTNMNTDTHMNSNTIPSLNTPIGSPTALNQGMKMGGSSTSANGGYTKPNVIPTSANGAKPSYPAGPKLGPTTSTSSMMTTAVGMESDVEIPGENKEVRRAHHNALERKRRDHIKESFTSLRDQVPQLNGEKSSRAAILNSARDYITVLKGTNGQVEAEVDSLTKENMSLLDQIRALEAAIGPAAEPVYPGGPNCHTTEASPYAFQGLNGPVLNQGGLP